ncbi:MAG: DNA polymerase I [Fimbriimonadaceae bacterium]|nr:DNA polymerase I [Fimbriimonadaceae bacterium]
MEAKRLVIIDGYSLMFRAFYATRFMSTTDGRPTNALYGFVGMLFVLLEKVRPDAIVVALDAPGQTFRDVEYAEYKGTRRETAPELISQLIVSRDLIAALGIPSLEVVGYEADDVVGTIARKAEASGYHTTIVTGDLDSLQLVDPCISVLTNKVGVTDTVTYDVEAVVARYGFGPEHIADYKALVGDTSDNIPGVPGIGEKSATKLILEFGSVETIAERIDEVEEKFRKKIEPNIEQMMKSKWLATIDCNVPVEYDFNPFVLTTEQLEQAAAILESFEMKNHLRRLSLVLGPYLDGAVRDEPVASDVQESLRVNDLGRTESFADLQAWIAGKPFSVLYGSVTGQPSMFEDGPTSMAWVAVGHEVRETSGEAADRLVTELPASAILHDAKPIWKRLGIDAVPGFDTSLAGFVLQSNRANPVLRDLIQGYLDVEQPNTHKGEAVGLALLQPAMRIRLEKESQLKVLEDIELPLVPILSQMEMMGVAVDPQHLSTLSGTLSAEIDKMAARIFEQAGQEFVIGSPKQLGEVLFDKLGLPSQKKTKTGYATGAEVLQELVNDNPIAADVLNWRELTKLKNTYADSLPKMIGRDGRIHTTYNQTGAATGRLSSNDPNLQNIPIRTELGREIRKAFIAPPGAKLASFDYSQIELRLLAHYCQDDALVDAFSHRVDVHRVTASLMFGVPQEEVSKEMRGRAKTLNYAVLYGVTGYGLKQQLGEAFSLSEAQALIDQYYERFPKIKNFTTSLIEEARAKGFNTTLVGRRRYFPDIHAPKRNERLYAERQAVNAPMQGSASDMIKLAMIKIHQRLRSSHTSMLLQVHDELLFEMPERDERDIEPIRELMEQALPLSVPVEVDAKLGENWSEMTETERHVPVG